MRTLRTLQMRASLIIGLALNTLLVQATTYYVSPNGNDASTGTSQGSAWRTIDRVNQVTNALQPGDQILFERGGHFRGGLYWASSGSASAPIVYGAYGTGADPIIDGARAVTGWVQHSGNVWKAHVGTRVDQVWIGGQRSVLARTPNTGWFRNDQAYGTSLHSSSLTQPDGFWTGTRCVVRNTASSVDTLPVVGYSNGTLTFSVSPINGNMGVDDWGFYLEKRLDLLDAPNEWFYDATSGDLYLQAPGNADPNGLGVEASTEYAGVWGQPNQHHGRVEHITFRHFRNSAIRVDVCSYLTVTACTMEDMYHGIRSYGHHNTFSNNTIRRTLATGAFIIDNNSVFENNSLEHIAEVMGEGESGWGYFGIRCAGPDNTIRNNRFEGIGYIAIIADDNQLVEKNIVHNYLTLLNDGGAIAFDNSDGLTIQDNVIYDVVCNLDGSSTVMPHYARYGHGIYFGNQSNVNTTVRRNTIANVSGVGIVADHTMNSHGWQVRDNTIFNCDIGMSIGDYSNANGPHAVSPYYVANYDDQYTGNIIYGLRKDQLALRFYNCYSALPTDFGTFANNRYFNPYNEIGIFHFGFLSGQYYYGLEHWQAVRGEEQGSTRSPLHLSEWTTTSELSGELLPNGTFPDAVTGWEYWPTNVQVTHDMNELDNGCASIHLPDNSQMTYSAMRNNAWFPLQNGQNDWYRLDISTRSNAPGYVLARVRGESQTNNPYALWERMLPFGVDRRDHSYYFQSPNAEDAQVVLVNQWTEPMYYLDNVHLHKVQVQENDPLEHQIILINDQLTDQTFTLEGCWSDVNGQYFSGSVTLQGSTSKVLVKEDDDLCGLSTDVEGGITVADGGGVYPNPVKAGTRLGFRNPVSGTASFIGANGQTVASVFLPPASLSIEVPNGLEEGIYALRIAGSTSGTERIIVE